MNDYRAKYSVALALLATPTLVHAYIDPGTGSILIQGLIAVVIGALFTVKIWWHRVRSFFTRQPPPDSPADDPAGRAPD